MPNRILKESIHTSDDVAEMSDIEFRVWMALITYVDDYGRGDGRAAIIKGSCFPLIERITPRVIDKAIDGLCRIGCVKRYTVDGKAYLYLPKWSEHQRVRNSVERFPAPPENDENEQVSDSSPQVAASCGESPQIAARAGAESESESESEYESINDDEARACACVREEAPTVDEVAEYIREKKYSISAKRFCAYYKKRGWDNVGDWRERVDEWSQNGIADKGRDPTPPPSSFETDEFYEAALKRSYDDELVGDLKKLVEVTA